MLILVPNCHCFCEHSGSVSGSLVAVQSLSVCREHGDSQAHSMPCSWGAAAFLAPPGWQTLACLLCCFPRGCWLCLQGCGCKPMRVCRGSGGWGCRSVSHGVLCSPGTALERVPACVSTRLVCSPWPDILSCGTWISLPAPVCAHAGLWLCLAFRTVRVPCGSSSNAFSHTSLNNH